MRPQTCLSSACLLLWLACQASVLGLDNGLSFTPAMGFNTWNAFYCNINETLVRQLLDEFIVMGLPDAGYKYFNLDDCWHNRSRSAAGLLQADSVRFPSGISGLSDYVHSKGLYFGIYSDAGATTCQGYPGSLRHEADDAAVFASWGVDYLKYDNCASLPMDVKQRYTAMRDALNATGRPIVFSMCEWGLANPWLWAPQVGNSWRTTGDIAPAWGDILRCLDESVGIARYAGPGAWNDPDMLEVGNGALTHAEQRSHFALWAILKSPLLIGADLRQMCDASLKILKAKEVIAVNQDPLGVAGDLIWFEGNRQIYAVPLEGGSRAVVLFNRLGYGGWNDVTVTWEMLGLMPAKPAFVRNLYAEQDLGSFTGSFTAGVLEHDVVVVKITPVNPSDHPDLNTWRPWHVNSDAVKAVRRMRMKEGQRHAGALRGQGTGSAWGRAVQE